MFLQEGYSESSELISIETLDIEASTNSRDASRPVDNCIVIYEEKVEDRLPGNIFLSMFDVNFIYERFSTNRSMKYWDLQNLCVRIKGKTRRLWSRLDSWGFSSRAGSYGGCWTIVKLGRGMSAAGLAALYLGDDEPLTTIPIINQTCLIIIAR